MWRLLKSQVSILPIEDRKIIEEIKSKKPIRDYWFTKTAVAFVWSGWIAVIIYQWWSGGTSVWCLSATVFTKILDSAQVYAGPVVRWSIVLALRHQKFLQLRIKIIIAIIVGQNTFGKGTVQQNRSLNFTFDLNQTRWAIFILSVKLIILRI